MTLYHYTSGQGLFGLLNSDELHCSNVNFLNDPSEISYYQNLIRLVLNKSIDCKEIYETLFNTSFQKSVTNPFETYVASFSKNEDSLSMWNYYAVGNGYNIGLDIDNIVTRNSNFNLLIQKIELVYDQRKQLKDTIEFILSHKANCKRYQELDEELKYTTDDGDYYNFTQEQINLLDEFNHGIYKLGLGFKHHAYESEQEVRLIISENKNEQSTTKFKISSNGVFVEYITLKLFLKSNIKSITIHPLNGPLHLEGTKKFIASLNIDKEIDIKVSKIPFRLV